MTGGIKLDFFSRVLAIACLICVEDIYGIELKSPYFLSFYNLTSLPNSMLMNETLVSDQGNTPTVVSCSFFCVKNERYSFYYNQKENTCYCNKDIDTRLTPGHTSSEDAGEIVYGYISSSLQVSTNNTMLKYEIQPYKEDCLALYHQGYTTNAIYTVLPTGGDIQDTFCDMDSVLDVGADDCFQWLQIGYQDDGVYNIQLSNGTTVRAWCDQTGGGWTVVQRRQDGSVDFYRNWAEYVNGFGDAAGEYWLGLEAIYLLSQQQSSLRIDIEAFPNMSPLTVYVLYGDFSLASATDKYRLSVDNFTGDCGDALWSNNQQQFSTWDSDNDSHSSRHCAQYTSGAWWHKKCTAINPNGIYHGQNTTGVTGIVYSSCWPDLSSLKTFTIGIKRN